MFRIAYSLSGTARHIMGLDNNRCALMRKRSAWQWHTETQLHSSARVALLTAGNRVCVHCARAARETANAADGLDDRFSFPLGWTGERTPQYVIHFCNDIIGFAGTPADAVKLATEWNAARWA